MLRAIDPSTGELVRELAPDAPATVERKLDAARAAYSGWAERTFADRAERLRAVAAQLRAEVDTLAPLLTEEMGKPIREARGEVDKCALCAEHYAEHAEAYLATETLPSDAQRSIVQYLPLGTVLGILPWNSPLWLAFRVAAPALMAGNVVLIKPDPHVPGTGAALPEIFERAGVPSGVLDVLSIETPAVEGVIRDRRVAAVSFTGSTRGGMAVGAAAGREVKPVVLELGGSDPAIVLEDADLDRAAEVLVFSRLIATGQSCIAPKRFLVHEAVHDDFVGRLRQRLEAVRMGDPKQPETQLGPMARADLRDELHRQVQASVDAGAQRVLGGVLPEGPGCFYPPTLLTGVTPEMTAFREETFGPVIPVTRVAGEAEAIRLANDTEYGLAASLWTDGERGAALARRIEAGQVVVNGIVKTDPRLPSGGIKRSGHGRELGPHGIREFVNAQQVWIGPKTG